MSKLVSFRRGRSLGAKISGEGSSIGNIFGFYKTRHILLSDSANCTVLCAVVLTQYRRVTDGQTDGRTDGQTDGIAIGGTAHCGALYKFKADDSEDTQFGVTYHAYANSHHCQYLYRI